MKPSHLAGAALLLMALQPALGASPDGLLKAAHQAMGGTALDHVVTWHESGKLTGGGLTGHYDALFDLPGQRSVESYALGPASGASGWDGKQSWTTDSSKEVRIETSAEATAQSIGETYRLTYAMFYPARRAAAIERSADEQLGGTTYPAVKVTPTDAEPFEIWFDPATHLIAREVQLTGAQPHTFVFEGWHRLGGVMVPATVIDRVGNDPKYDVVTSDAKIVFEPAAPDTRYAPPPPPAADAMWPAGADRVSVPFKLMNNHIYVAAAIDGKPPEPFVFDTGATNVLNAEATQHLGLKVEGALPGGGFGDSISSVGLTKVKSVSIGGLALPDQVFSTIASGGWTKVEGTESTGLLGYEFVKRAVLTIDYAHRTMIFVKPVDFQPPAGVTPIPFRFDGHIPMVSGTLDGIAGEFEIDTGSRGALTVMHPFAKTNGLIEKLHATRLATVGYGVGGPSRALLGRPGSLQIGPITLGQPVAEFATDTHGAAADARTAGNIGGDILKRFTLTLDYEHRVLYLQPNELATEPEAFDRSGLWLSRTDDGSFQVDDVTKDSAGSRAGLVKGDKIVTIDGRKTTGIVLSDLRDELKSAAGRKITFGIKGKNGERDVALVLADQV